MLGACHKSSGGDPLIKLFGPHCSTAVTFPCIMTQPLFFHKDIMSYSGYLGE